MALENNIRENWEKLQQRYNHPVDAIGRPIDQKDHETLSSWQGEGIDNFMQK